MAKSLFYPIGWYLDRLEGVDGDESEGSAWCPCHPDLGTSWKGLTYRVTDKILMHCHSCGANLVDVTVALEEMEGIEREIPVVNVKSHTNGAGPASHVTRAHASDVMRWWIQKTGVDQAIWESLGCHAEGSEIQFHFEGYQVYKYRRPPKEFGWSEKGADVPPLWPVPDDNLPKHVWVVEGESDTGTARAAGFHAYGITRGAGRGEKRYLDTHHFEALKERGCEEVTLCGDFDDSGREFLEQCSKMATDAGLVVNKVRLELILDPFSGINDLNSMWREVKSIKHFKELLNRATQRVATRFRALTNEDMVRLNEQEVPWLIPNLIAPNDKVLVSGPQKNHKTNVTLDLVRTLAAGKPFLNRPEWTPKKTHRVLVIEEEGSEWAWARRVKKLDLPKSAEVTWFHRQGIFFTEPGTIDEVIAFCRENAIDAVVFDPLQRMMPGVDENDSSATGVVWDEIFRLQFACPGIVCIVVHHSNKTERLTWESVRGSSRHAGEVDLGIFVQKDRDDRNRIEIAIDGRDVNTEFGEDTLDGRITITETSMVIDATQVTSVKVTPRQKQKREAAENKDDVLNAICDGCRTKHAIISQTELAEATVRRHLDALIAENKIVEIDPGPGKAKIYEEKDD